MLPAYLMQLQISNGGGGLGVKEPLKTEEDISIKYRYFLRIF
jgi:hypothetical protein